LTVAASTALDQVSRALLVAQCHAAALFAEVLDTGLIAPGKLESELTAQIHELAQRRFGVRRHWHKRIARAGANTVLSYHDDPPDRRIAEDDVVYLDFGPVFESWEADFGRTYALGSDPVKHKLVHDIESAFHCGKAYFQEHQELTCGELYDFVVSLAGAAGWEFGNISAGHLVGQFPHEAASAVGAPLSIRHGNNLRLRELDASGTARHWILEIHFIDREKQIGGFFEDLLTVAY
jgi:Xaa-Pro dipeptidase